MTDVLAAILWAVVALAVAWAVLVAVLWLHRPSRERAGLMLKIVPDLARLCWRVATARDTPRRYRVGLVLLGVYLASPIDVIPDFLPGIGSLDDVILAGLVLRWVGRGIGPDRIERLWPGSAEGLTVLRQLLGLPKPLRG